MHIQRFFQLPILTLIFTLVTLSVSGVDAKPNHEVSIAHLSEAQFTISKIDNDNLENRLEISTNGIVRTFNLVENKSLLSAPLKLKLHSSISLYKGTLENVTNSWARFSLVGEKLTGAFYDGQDLYFVNYKSQLNAQLNNIESSKEVTSDLLIYNAKDVSHSATCALENSAIQSAFSYSGYIDELAQMTSEMASKEILISLVADSEFETGDPQDAATEMLVEMNVVDGIFSEQVGVQVTVDDIRVLEDNGTLTMSDAEDLIVAYRTYVAINYNNPGISHLFTGKDLDGSTIGIAYVGAVCNSYSVGVTQRFGSSTALVTAHEIGHNFGAPHDNQSGSACAATNGSFLMSPSINGSDQFSDCSLTQMDALVSSAACLTNVSPPTIISTPNTTATAGLAYEYDTDSRVDADGSGSLTFNLDFGPEGMTVSEDGLVEWIPIETQTGTSLVQISASNAYGTDTQNFEIEVTQNPSGEFLNFNELPYSSFSTGQDFEGTVTIGDSGASITLQGNRWVKVDFNYAIQADTVIEFDFISTSLGEIHGIGLDDDNKMEEARTFSLAGSQSWGLESARYTEFGEVQRISIPVGQFYTGNVEFLYFAMDNDVEGSTANGTYSNVTVYNINDDTVAPTETLDLSQFTFSEFDPAQNPSGSSVSEVIDDGETLHLQGNLWRKIDLNQDITENTMITFDFKSTSQGEIHGIGFYTTDLADRDETFKLYGTQEWGLGGFNYSGNGEYQSFTIPIGQYYAQGTYPYLVFAMDNDISEPVSNSYFSRISIFESSDEEPPSNEGLNFNELDILDLDPNQNPEGASTITILDAGYTLQLEGNLWQKIELNTDITSGTVLEFEFKSTAEGEIHGIGFTNNAFTNESLTFRLFGTQVWGNHDFQYTGDGEYQTFVIPIGEYFTGFYPYIVFGMDNDVENPNSDSVFRNVIIR
ncbi:M12 family metallo-peptidase [Aliiglaciecola sp. 3_MG-2023]|uniref:M12 family metallo-peptidase n=1 Tax=Aliiglaciecola sp. 3_MG-2023 TaxID=3062644 RepID=UPI0026E3DE39|nr:M12 family metallo-peptidase [Aliiglaciecola sp. 3_MG-2023]MDO6692095.1 M12 family metallo-peptidase [Aliiglaciecola sp. 3_MG-2023]